MTQTYRVKVYKLNPDDNQWTDKGTGNVKLEFVEAYSFMGIVVTSEEDNATILQTKVCIDDIYQQQQDTLIVWNEPETEEDLAISFVDKKSCLELWNQLCKVQSKLKSAERELPAPTYANLRQLDKLITEVSLSNRDNLGLSLCNEAGYIDTLFELYEAKEKPQEVDCDSLNELMFSIFKGMILLNEPNLLESLLSDESILRLMDVLQHDPNIPKQKRVNHKEFLTNVSVFKEVIPIKDEELISKIHQTFRIKYLRDSVLLSVLDDTTCSSLNTLIFYNNIEILTILQNNHTFLEDLFAALLNEENTDEQKVDLISFFQQFCELAKNLQDDSRVNFYKLLQKMGLFTVFERYFAESNNTILLSLLDILTSTIFHIPNEVRDYISSESQSPDYPLMTSIINCMMHSSDQGITSQIAELLRRLLDIDQADANSPAERFIVAFYDHFLDKLMIPTSPSYQTTLNNKNSNNNDDDISSSSNNNNQHHNHHNHHKTLKYYNLVNQIYDVLSYCIPKHGFRVREKILQSAILENSLRFLDLQGFLTLSVIRLFRAVIGQKNRNYERKIIRQKLFNPLMISFRANGHRNNMLNSAMLELFNFIDRDCYNNHKLIAHLVENYRSDFENINYVNTFRNLITKYDNHKDFLSTQSSTSSSKEPARKRRHEEAFDETLEDDLYFNNSDEDEATTPPTGEEESVTQFQPPSKSKLANQNEDDEEEIHTPIIRKKKEVLKISIKPKNNSPPLTTSSPDQSNHSNNNNNYDDDGNNTTSSPELNHESDLYHDGNNNTTSNNNFSEEVDGSIKQKTKRIKLQPDE